MSEVTINRLRNAGNVCHDCGTRWGEPRGGDCTQWYGTCGVCGQYKACCDTRNYGYLIKGRKELGRCLLVPTTFTTPPRLISSNPPSTTDVQSQNLSGIASLCGLPG
jgi:hypothetical protein